VAKKSPSFEGFSRDRVSIKRSRIPKKTTPPLGVSIRRVVVPSRSPVLTRPRSSLGTSLSRPFGFCRSTTFVVATVEAGVLCSFLFLVLPVGALVCFLSRRILTEKTLGRRKPHARTRSTPPRRSPPSGDPTILAAFGGAPQVSVDPSEQHFRLGNESATSYCACGFSRLFVP